MARSGGYRRTQKPKPATAAEGVSYVRKHAIGLFDREDGHAADWQMIAETLFLTALAAIDEAPETPRRAECLHRMQTAAYDRLAGNTVRTESGSGPSQPSHGQPSPGHRPAERRPELAPKGPFGR